MRPHIRPAQGHEQVDVGRPGPDALEVDQGRPRPRIAHPLESIGIKSAIQNTLGKPAGIAGLLPAEADLLEGRVVELQHGRRGDRPTGIGQAVEGRPGGGQRDLLLEDDEDERGEPGLARPQRWYPMQGDHPGEVGIAAGQGARGATQAQRCKRGHCAIV
jgi:hypothetical protein